MKRASTAGFTLVELLARGWKQTLQMLGRSPFEQPQPVLTQGYLLFAADHERHSDLAGDGVRVYTSVGGPLPMARSTSGG